MKIIYNFKIKTQANVLKLEYTLMSRSNNYIFLYLYTYFFIICVNEKRKIMLLISFFNSLINKKIVNEQYFSYRLFLNIFTSVNYANKYTIYWIKKTVKLYTNLTCQINKVYEERKLANKLEQLNDDNFIHYFFWKFIFTSK